jgi:CBS domain containing-hemolysin-like protein
VRDARLLGARARDLDPPRPRGAAQTALEGRLSGALPPQAEALAQNVLKLRSTPVARAMVPWERVQRLRSTGSNSELYAAVAASPFTRLPVVGPDGEVEGYVHQLDVLGRGRRSRCSTPCSR